MKLSVEIKASSEETKWFSFEANGSGVDGSLLFKEGVVYVEVIPVQQEVTCEYGLNGAYAIFLKSDCDIALSYFRLVYDIRALSKTEDAMYYNAATCTNDFSSVDKFSANLMMPAGFSRDIFMAQGSGLRINMAFATFRRFFTRFILTDESLIAEQALEDKIIKADTVYELEHVLLDDVNQAGCFFEKYTVYLSNTHDIPAFKYIPRGWSSWSCYYLQIDEEKILRQAKLMQKTLLPVGGDLLQLDDGWEKGGSFGAYWTTDIEKFPNGIEGLQNQLSDMGIRFGIWMAPGLIISSSTRFDEFFDILVRDKDGNIIRCFGTGEKDGKPIGVFALDLGKEETIAHTEEMFKRGVDVYKCDYFKIDFITNLLFRAGNGWTPIIYDSDYSVGLYRRWIQHIRKTTGDETFLLACGAPVGESIGVFDAIRVSPDITWGGAGKNGNPTAYELIKKNAQNIFLRSPYHKRVFINDPDALLVRSYLTEYTDDGLCMTDDEAMLWATVVSNCGGHILLNEEIEKLSEVRLALIKRIMKEPLPTAARPKSFFEYPLCTETYIPFEDGVVAEDIFVTRRLMGDNGSILCTVYNWGENCIQKNVEVASYFNKDVTEAYIFRAVDRWDGRVIADFRHSFDIGLNPHACKSFYIKPFNKFF